ncbi:MAG: hypothetical protein ACXACY_23595 [Candidatus Hodarchaeales archaeon]|jgi:hypothetical protein
MKIHYEPYPGFNEKYDFDFGDDAAMRLSFVEPEEPKLMREIGVNYIVEEITERYGFIFSAQVSLLMEQLIPEQIRVLVSHAYKIYHSYRPFSKSYFIDRLHIEFQQIAKQEIEPGVFKNEDIL